MWTRIDGARIVMNELHPGGGEAKGGDLDMLKAVNIFSVAFLLSRISRLRALT